MGDYMKKKIVVGFDGSQGSWRALDESVRLARLENCRLDIVSIEEIARYPATVGEVMEEEEAESALFTQLHQQAVEKSIHAGLPVDQVSAHIKIGHPARALIDYVAESKADLLVIGHSGHSGIWGTFLGTTADKIVRHAGCSVLIVR
jgi:nucleotide-binding universal stress UspA family protein